MYGAAGNDTYVFDPSVGNLGTDTVQEDNSVDSDTLDFSNFSDDVDGRSERACLEN